MELPLVGALNVPVPPLRMFHDPIPTKGVFPPSALLTNMLQIFCVKPTVAAVGKALFVNVTSSVEIQVPFVIVHRKVALVPAAIPVTVEVGDNGLVIVADPETSDQEPVPIDGLFPARVNVLLLQFD